ncbi:hypothetical protein ABPG75_007231 [Micractinium tetrahymenae]
MASVSSYRNLALQARPPQQLASSRARLAGRRSNRKLQPPAALLGGLLQQLQSLGRAEGGGAAAGSSKVAAARRRLLEQLSSERPDTAVVSEACDELMEACVPFKEADLGGGPWQVVYTRGPLLWQLWQGGTNASARGRMADPGGNKASQNFDPSTRRVVNRGELLGPAVTVTASGSYEPVPGETGGSSSSGSSGGGSGSAARTAGRCPVLVRASIEGGALEAWGARLPLPIRGSGLVEVAYLDSQGLRIFRATNGSLSLQMRERPRRQQPGPR